MNHQLAKMAISQMLYPHKGRKTRRPRRIETMQRELGMKLAALPGAPAPPPSPGAAPLSKVPALPKTPTPKSTVPAAAPKPPPLPTASIQQKQISKTYDKAYNAWRFKGLAEKKTTSPEGVGLSDIGVPPAKTGSLKLAQVPPPPVTPVAPPPAPPAPPAPPTPSAPAPVPQPLMSPTTIPQGPIPQSPYFAMAPEAERSFAQAWAPRAPIQASPDETVAPSWNVEEPEAPTTASQAWQTTKDVGKGILGQALSLNPIGEGFGSPEDSAGKAFATGAGGWAAKGLMFGGPLGAAAGAIVGGPAALYKRWLEGKKGFSSRLAPGEVYAEDDPSAGRYKMRTGAELEKDVESGKFTAEQAQGDPMNPYWDYARSKGQVLGGGMSFPSGKRLPVPGEEAYAKMEKDMEQYGEVQESTKQQFPDDPNALKTGSLHLRVNRLRAIQKRASFTRSATPTVIFKRASPRDSFLLRDIIKQATLEKNAQWWRTAGAALARGGGRALTGAGRWGKRLAIGVPLAAGGLLYAATPSEQAMPGTSFLGRAAAMLGGGYLGGKASEAAGMGFWPGALLGGAALPGMIGGMGQPGGMGGGIQGLMSNPLVTGLGSYMLAKKLAPEGVMGMSPGMIGLLGGALGPSLAQGIGGIGGGAPGPIYGGAAG